MDNSQDVEGFLRRNLEAKEAELLAGEEALGPLRDEVKKLRIMLRDYTAGSMSSGHISDNDVVTFVKKHASEGGPLSTSEVAAGLGGDGRGFSRRLPRMVKDGLLAGDAENGYYVDIKTRVRA